MQERTFRAMGTEWWVGACGVRPSLLDRAEALVHDAEARLSRFREDSALSTLNRCRSATDHTLAEVVRAALDWRDATRGVFDPTVGAALAAAGYDRTFESIEPGRPVRTDIRRPAVSVEADNVRLGGGGLLDLGGIGKGWAVDRVADFLEACGIDRYLVDGGGDIRAGGTALAPWPVGVGDGLVAYLGPGAVATSSTSRRRWTTGGGTGHHIIDTTTGQPAARGVRDAVVVHRRATAADVLATTLVAGGVGTLAVVQEHGADALIEGEDGAWWMTPGMKMWLDGPTLA